MQTGTDRALRGHEDALYRMVFSSDESTLLSASDDQTARVWDVSTGSWRALRGHEDDVYNAALSPDGRLVATASFDSSIRLWQLGGNDEVSQVVGRVEDLEDSKSFVSEDGNMVLTRTHDVGHSWDLDTGERRTVRYEWPGKLDPRYFYIAFPMFDRRSRRFVLPQEDGVVDVLSLDSSEKVSVGGAEAGIATALALSRDGRTLVSVADDGRVLVWDVTAGEHGEPRVLARDRHARGAALSPDGSKLAVWVENRIELFDMATGSVLDSLDMDEARPGTRQPRAIRFSPDGNALAAWANPSASLVMWNIRAGRVERIDLVGHELINAAFAPDSSRLALAVADRTLRLIDVHTGKSRVLRGHGDMVYDVVWSPDGKTLASPSYDRTIRLWDVDTQLVRVLRGHSRSVDSVAFSSDGKTLTSVAADRTVRRWDLERLPDQRAEAVPLRLAAATTAVIGATERAESQPPGRAAAAVPGR
jgi:WD40 repeat protein